VGNTVKFDKLPEGKRRLFGKREPITIELPAKAQELYGVVSVEIEPMTHRDARVREQIKAKIESEKAKANHSTGVKPSELSQYWSDHLAVATMAEKVNAMLPDLPETEDECELEKAIAKIKEVQNSKEYLKKKAEFESAEMTHLKKYDDLISKIKMRDMSGVYDAESDLEENAFDTVYKYVKKITAKDGTDETELQSVMIQPDFVMWLLGEIENISYLNEGEITAFR